MLVTENRGSFAPKNYKIAVVVAEFNDRVTGSLKEGAVNTLLRYGISKENIEIYWVPGAYEIPLTCKRIIKNKKIDGVIALGAVIQGETSHFDYVSGGVSSGIMNVSLETNTPIAFGILTTQTVEQALNRAGLKSGNKGSEVAISLIELLELYSQTGI